LTTATVPLSPISLRLCAGQPWPDAVAGDLTTGWVFDLRAAERWCPRPGGAAITSWPLAPELIAARVEAEAVLRAAAPDVVGLALTAPMPLALLGLGPGLTPAGDDVLSGRLLAHHAGWLSVDAPAVAEILITAAARTTRLSQALLAAAADGECSQPWHDLWSSSRGSRSEAIRVILETGQTSGAAMLWGFLTAIEAHEQPAPDRQPPGLSDPRCRL
jgi:hypothetical protein